MKNIIYLLLLLLIGCPYNDIDEKIVKYTVSGTAVSADIQYTIGDYLSESDNQSLPWEYEYKLTNEDEDTYILILSAEKLTGDNSTIIMEIYVDGILVNYTNFSGPNERQTIQANVVF